MRAIHGVFRDVRKELEGIGITKDTNEIRDSYDLVSAKTSLTYLSAEDPPQEPHRHLIVLEATQVLFGEVDICVGGKWNPVCARHGVEFGRREIHNMRASSRSERQLSIGFPIGNITGVTMTTKWIPPGLDVKKDEIESVLKYDWFHADDKKAPYHLRKSPLANPRLEKQRKQFQDIVDRNRGKT